MTSVPLKGLLAKSVPDPTNPFTSATLPGHLADVASSADAILESVGNELLSAFGLTADGWQQRLRSTLMLAAWLHDIGKANNHFQPAVHRTADKDDRQPIRHEWISVWIATRPEMKNWLLPAVGSCESCWIIAQFAIAGHHPKVNRAQPSDESFKTQPIAIANSHPDFIACLQQIQRYFNLDDEIPTVPSTVYAGTGDQRSIDLFQNTLNGLSKTWKKIRQDSQWKCFCAVVKSALVAADVAGSALWEQIDTIGERQNWIRSSLTRTATKQDLDQIVDARLDGKEPRDFQNQIAQSSADVTLVEAGCGSGKTLAAYMWAAKQHAGRRLWFCYPTTGTATEGYKGYLFDKLPNESQSQARLFHSRADYDIKMMLETNDRTEEMDDSAVRVASLQAWDTQIVACTVDTVLCLLQNQRRGLYAWPALAGAAIVFDEIHCYDDKLFGNLLTWLKHLVGIPVLLMTASLPNAKRDAIISAVRESNRSFRHIPNGPPELENLNRYQLACTTPKETSLNDCLKMVEYEILERGGRVLWISNTVNRTRDLGAHFLDVQPIVYHSRFIYEDRLARHTEVVELFENETKTGFASTSQVAEMSLDLAYATLLVTELAPIPALIQRLGRLNRRADPRCNPPVVKSFVVIEPISNGEIVAAPYEDAELELARKWLNGLDIEPLSQSDLIRHWHQLDQSSVIAAESSGWLAGGLATPVDTIRKSSYGITVICQRHLSLARQNGAAAYALPMDRPHREHWQASEYRFRGFPIASDEAIDYSPETGGKWATHNVL